MDAELATSRYTFRLPLPDGFALFNGSTGSVLRLQGTDAAEISGTSKRTTGTRAQRYVR